MGKQILFAAIIVFIAGVLMFLIIKAKPEAKKQEVVVSDLVVDALEVYQKDISLVIASQGNVQPKKQTLLTAQVSGKIENVSPRFVEGNFVKQGEFLIKIEDSDYRRQLQLAKSNVINAESSLAQEESRARVAQQEWEWRERKALSAKAKESALRKPQLRAANAGVRTAQLEVENVLEQLRRTTITAPYDAIIRNKQVEQGQYVAPGNQLGSLFSTQAAEIRLSVPQDKLKFLDLPDVTEEETKKTVLIYENEDKKNSIMWSASLERSESIIDPQTHFIYLIAEVKDPYNFLKQQQAELRIGAFVYADIIGKTLENLVKLDNSYIRAGNNVWIINAQNKLENRRINTIYSEGDYSYVQSGLADGDKIVTTVITGYLEGTKVKINKLTSQLDDSQQTALLQNNNSSVDISLPSSNVDKSVDEVIAEREQAQRDAENQENLQKRNAQDNQSGNDSAVEEATKAGS